MNPAFYRKQLERLIDVALKDLHFSGSDMEAFWTRDWKGQYQKSLRLKIIFSDVEITVCHDMDPRLCSDFRLECSLGHVQPSSKDELFRNLLEENLSFEPSSCKGFGWDKNGKNVVFSMPCPIAAPSGNSLTPALFNLATHAKIWREKLLGHATLASV